MIVVATLFVVIALFILPIPAMIWLEDHLDVPPAFSGMVLYAASLAALIFLAP